MRLRRGLRRNACRSRRSCRSCPRAVTSAPQFAVCVSLIAVLPDDDALSRFGKALPTVARRWPFPCTVERAPLTGKEAREHSGDPIFVAYDFLKEQTPPLGPVVRLGFRGLAGALPAGLKMHHGRKISWALFRLEACHLKGVSLQLFAPLPENSGVSR